MLQLATAPLMRAKSHPIPPNRMAATNIAEHTFAKCLAEDVTFIFMLKMKATASHKIVSAGYAIGAIINVNNAQPPPSSLVGQADE
jgi:hypothetical protein